MKKIILIASVALFAVSFTSCKKDYTCTCFKTEPGTTAQKYQFTIENQKQKNADNACAAKSYVNGTVDYSCSLD